MLENWKDPSRQLLTDEDEARLVAAIGRAEAATSGEIRVHLESRCPGDAAQAALRWFERLGMTRTAERNGILFYVAVADRKFAVVGDAGIHGRVSPSLWSELRDLVEARFRTGDFGAGLEQAIEAAGEALGREFPRRSDDRNELPDGLSRG